MATILNDEELKSLFGTVIMNANESGLRPNSYVMRLGASGEFINTGKKFDLSKNKKGILIPPGHSVGITAYEDLDFSREAVHQVFPDHDLHAVVSPNTDLSREGISAATTQVDAGYEGTLNWTFTNNSNEERRFIYKERIYRITIFKLDEDETPENLYNGHYQAKKGYVSSKRRGAPVGMKQTDWEGPFEKGGPEDLLDELISSGYPWGRLGKRLKQIDRQFKEVTNEYSEVHDAIEGLKSDIGKMRKRQEDTPDTVRKVLREEIGSLQNRWLIGAGSIFIILFGLVLTISTSPDIWQFFQEYGVGIGILLILIFAAVLIFIVRQK